MMKLKDFRISYSSSLREALLLIELNHEGIVFLIKDNNVVCGVATDGDIRRWMLAGGSLDDPIDNCACHDFIWATSSTPR